MSAASLVSIIARKMLKYEAHNNIESPVTDFLSQEIIGLKHER